jgi:hypothetical protein
MALGGGSWVATLGLLFFFTLVSATALGVGQGVLRTTGALPVACAGARDA